MKLLKKKNYEGTLRKVVDDEKTRVLGVVGTVDDLLEEKVLDYCDAPRGMWACVRTDYKAFFAGNRDDAIIAAGIQ